MAKCIRNAFEKKKRFSEPSKLARAMQKGLLQEDDAVETILSCLKFLRSESSEQAKSRLSKSCEVEESLAISICCLAVEGKLDLISASDFQQSMNILLCSSRKSPRLLALLRFFASLFDREYGGNLSNALRSYFSVHESESNQHHSRASQDSDSVISGSSSPLLSAEFYRKMPEDSDESFFSPPKQAPFTPDSDADEEFPTVYSSLRPTDVMLCSLGPCHCCRGTLIAHIRAVSCAGCGQHRQNGMDPSNFDGPRMTRNLSSNNVCSQERRISTLNKRAAKRDDEFVAKTPEVTKEPDSLATVSSASKNRKSGASATLEELTSDFGSPEVHRADNESDLDPEDLSPCPLSLVQGAHDLVGRIRERFLNAPDMVQNLVSILRNVISHQITSKDARVQLRTLLSNPEHSDLLDYILRFIPDSDDTSQHFEDADIEEEEEVAPSESLNSGSPYSRHADISGNESQTANLCTGKKEDVEVSKPKSSSKPQRQHAPQSHRYRRFSEQEKEQIMDGVKRFGMGSRNLWRRIVSSYKFDRRSAVDIKDAFRTMQRAAWKKKKDVMDQRTPSRRSALDFTPFSNVIQDLPESQDESPRIFGQ